VGPAAESNSGKINSSNHINGYHLSKRGLKKGAKKSKEIIAPFTKYL